MPSSRSPHFPQSTKEWGMLMQVKRATNGLARARDSGIPPQAMAIREEKATPTRMPVASLPSPSSHQVFEQTTSENDCLAAGESVSGSSFTSARGPSRFRHCAVLIWSRSSDSQESSSRKRDSWNVLVLRGHARAMVAATYLYTPY